ncbi:arylsulfatase [Niabella ginsengisoli]|uniref:Arylsulfatase n=1 Tax=Niabella ginsengisoli TaxID=522298 RepID=A0ABS9SKU3_9BACT|nr:arylsulfatase [Niabella ginsengisoli]MCH5598983.1 arylsulfatase [Niabella ginsengisoli]
MHIRIFSFLFFYIISINAYAQKKSKPNIIVILADDMGFSDIGCYGGEVQTPNINNLAKEGIRYKQFYNAARCCPTRASLVTGLYPHQAGMGWMAAADLGTPAYQDNLNNECVTIAEVLKPAGYSTYMTGKWHLTNERKIDGYVTDNWPVQRGFDRYFGIIPGGANYYTPIIYSNNKRYKAPENFYLTDAISDTSVKYIQEHFTGNADNPFFMYVAYTSPHWPLHAPKEVIEKYKNTYSKGWDATREARFKRQKEIGLFDNDTKLTPRDARVPAWSTLDEKAKEEMSMRMAIYAAQIDIMDQGIGRIVNSLKELGQLDNTLILFLSDNGACAEYISSGKSKAVDGTEETFESYRINWANVSSTPFKEYKHFTHEGGIATPLIVHWPDGVKKDLNNHFVTEYGHLTDIMATCADVAKATYPATFEGHEIVPMQGKSLAPHFVGKSNNRGKVYWEHEANIALRDGKWKLVAKTEEDNQFSESGLQLYNMETDPTEMNDLSKQQPERVQSMYKEWNSWAHSIGAFPLDTREYNVRMRAYKRVINGSFDDNLGGWNIKVGEDANATIDIDETGQISGKKSAMISMTKPGNKPAAVNMNWAFPVKKGERFEIKLKTKSKTATSYFARLEKADGNAEKIINENIKVGNKLNDFHFTSAPAPEAGSYKLALYFGTLKPGDQVWLDDIELITLKNNYAEAIAFYMFIDAFHGCGSEQETCPVSKY